MFAKCLHFVRFPDKKADILKTKRDPEFLEKCYNETQRFKSYCETEDYKKLANFFEMEIVIVEGRSSKRFGTGRQ